MRDEELVERCLRGDTGVFSLLVDRYKGQVYNLAVKMLGNPLDAEDAAQETFLQAYRALPSFRGQARFSTWLLSRPGAAGAPGIRFPEGSDFSCAGP